jgi:TetR/AcrR family transcriptional regulator, regulator of cefoperazone and chloramphenicol sensitivity
MRGEMSHAHRQHPPDAGLPDDATPRQRLHAFVRVFLSRMLNDAQGTRMAKLMARELIEPSHVLDALVRDVMAPTSAYLLEVIESIVGRPLDEEERFFAVTSVMSQIVFQKHCRAVIDRMFPGQAQTPEQIDRLAQHVAELCYAGFEQMRRRDRRWSKSPRTPAPTSARSDPTPQRSA